jgi:hypothetical protein
MGQVHGSQPGAAEEKACAGWISNKSTSMKKTTVRLFLIITPVTDMLMCYGPWPLYYIVFTYALSFYVRH